MNTAEAPERLALEYGLADGIAVVQVAGEADVANCGVLRDGLLRIVTDEGFRGLLVNLPGVRFNAISVTSRAHCRRSARTHARVVSRLPACITG
jgi:hypothetical protein